MNKFENSIGIYRVAEKSPYTDQYPTISVALRGGALLNRSRNAAITWDMVCPVCCLSCTHTLATKRSSIE
jgi:hypothetical protein